MKIMKGQKMAKLMSNYLLDHHQIGADMFKPNYTNCVLYDVMKEVVFFFRHSAEMKKIELIESFGGELKQAVMADSLRIQQVLMNIL